MDDKLLKHSICNTEQLKNATIKIWNEISIEMIKKLYLSIPDRLEQVSQHKDFPCSA